MSHWRRSTAIPVLAVVGVSAFGVLMPIRSVLARQLAKTGLEQMSQHDFGRALRTLQLAVAVDPRHEIAHIEREKCAWLAGAHALESCDEQSSREMYLDIYDVSDLLVPLPASPDAI